ncbi:MAG: carboxylating nicotinate-nucleotide diphosphorylase [Candidatus Melainabacteria bacterium]|nr:MAG: carboxylating nicotinate-nucleotide diphosphorylase [Candidatus Melainabacteria bacterium]
MLDRFLIDKYVLSALEEDIGFGDITTDNLATEKDVLEAKLNTRSEGIVCGLKVFERVFKNLSDDVEIKFYFKDGDKIKAGDTIAELKGSASAILKGERTALNFAQRMSGIATETRKYQDAIGEGLKARISDTRKTTPNFRVFEKYAVYVGGACIHRFNLADCAMIKDNHIKLAGSLTKAVEKIRKNISHTHKIEVECDTLDQVKEAVACGADIIMLDNMSCETMKKAVEIINGKAITEASGNVNLSTVHAIAEVGVDIISSSAIVAKAPTLDLALDM